jgi:hypothetical protein
MQVQQVQPKLVGIGREMRAVGTRLALGHPGLLSDNEPSLNSLRLHTQPSRDEAWSIALLSTPQGELAERVGLDQTAMSRATPAGPTSPAT